MFPFSTDKFSGTTNLSFEDFINRLEKNVLKSVLYKTDENFYGKIDIGLAIFELGIKPIKDASRPVVVMKWSEDNGNIKVQTKCRLDYSSLFLILLILLFGIYLVIQDKNISSIIPPLIFSIIAYLGLYIFYTFNKVKTTTKLIELYKRLEIVETNSYPILNNLK